MGSTVMYSSKHNSLYIFDHKGLISKSRIVIRHSGRAEYVTVANVELDQQTPIESAIKLFKRECNNSNVISEMRRRRYHEKTWMMRRRKEKERIAKRKSTRNIITLDEKNPLRTHNI